MSYRLLNYTAAAGVLVVVLIAFGLGRCSAPDPEPQYREVQVPVESIREVERVDTVVTWRERIVYRTVEPTIIAVADSGGVPDVATFCAESIERAVREVATDSGPRTLADRPPSLLLRSARVSPGWFFAKDELYLTGPRSDGSLWQGTYSVRNGWQAHVRGSDVLVQSPRSAIVRELLEAGVWLGGGLAAGYVLGRVDN